MKNKKLQVWFPLFFSIAMIIGMFLGYKLRDKMPWASGMLQTHSSGQLQEVLDLIRGRYVDDVNTDSLREAAIDEMLSRLDPHSVYIPAKELKAVNEDLAGQFEGIGVEFNIFDDTLHVLTVMKDGPSEKAGLRSGDRIITVDGKKIAGLKLDADSIKALLKGPNASKVKVAILRGGSKKEFTITRGFIPIYALDAAYMLNNQSGYIRINKFSETTYEEFMAALEKLQAKGMKNLILDLRDNGGGILSEAVDMADEFLSGDKLIVYTEGNKNPKRQYTCKRKGLFENGELILLMNEGSASASEVLAGALQDWDRATIIGRRSFGKGLVQEQYTLTDGAALRLTVARYYTPLGRSIQKSYKNGNQSYMEEIGRRIHHPTEDSLIHQTKLYTTPAGKKVYGGGGITPDIKVNFNTTRLDSVITELFNRNTIGKFVYRYYLNNATLFEKYKQPSEFIKSFSINEEIFKSFKMFALKEAIDLKQINQVNKKFLEGRIKSLFARQIWRNEGYYEVANAQDPVIIRAMEVINDRLSLTRK